MSVRGSAITLTQPSGFALAGFVSVSAAMSLRLVVAVPLALTLFACQLPELGGAVQSNLVGKPKIGIEPIKKPKKPIKPSKKPSDKPTLKPNDKPNTKPVEKPTEKPSEQPTEKPVEPPQDSPSDPVEPPPDQPVAPPAPTGEETGPLIGLLAAHNDARAAVGVAPLVWSNEVAAHAQDWANHLAANNDCKLAHRPQNPYGQNLFWSSRAATAAQAVAMWVAEKANYDAASNTCTPNTVCGHYTQIVWANTTRLGCGRATCGGGAEIWVCNYDPRGNYNGQRPY